MLMTVVYVLHPRPDNVDRCVRWRHGGVEISRASRVCQARVAYGSPYARPYALASRSLDPEILEI